MTIRADDQRDMDAVPSKYVVYGLPIETSLLLYSAGFAINNSTFNDIQGDYYHVFLLADI